MDVKYLKEFIYENGRVEHILEDIGCGNIKYHSHGNPDPYWTASNPDGNNTSAINIYNKPSLQCINYTRDINGKNNHADIISLVCFLKDLPFSKGLKYVCDLLGLDYYRNPDDDLPESLRITKLIYEMQLNCDIDLDDKPLKPIHEKILSYYYPYVNDMFKDDGISYETQQEFEVGYDSETNRITIPVRDEIGNLIGVKARLFQNEISEEEKKYLYIEPCTRGKILYGLYKTYPYIKQSGKCYIGEAEKFCMQLWDKSIYNTVSTNSKKITNHQIEKLTRLGVDLIFCFDKDVIRKEIEDIADRFVDGVNIYYLFDDKNILKNKESPSDNFDNWNRLCNECLYKIK
jgi:DNA primase